MPCLRYRLLLENMFSVGFLRHVTLCSAIGIGCHCGKRECMLPRVFCLVLPTSLTFTSIACMMVRSLLWLERNRKGAHSLLHDMLLMNATSHQATRYIKVENGIPMHQPYHCTLQAVSSDNRVIVCQLKRTTSGYPNTVFTLASNHLTVTGSAQHHSPTLY